MQNLGPHGPRPKRKTFFSKISKPDPKLSKPFYFNKVAYVLAELSQLLSLEIALFSKKALHNIEKHS